jgi:lysyl-tRNA synthetase class 2
LTERVASQADWQPVASAALLKLRATLLARIRAYFDRQQVLEVDTPALSCAAATDPQLESFRTRYHGPGARNGTTLYLHTSPEFPMKRLLAAGSGSIYQICKVFRDGEAGAHHNPEFTLLEWYRTGFDHLDLMDDLERLLQAVLDGILQLDGVHHWTYRELFQEFAGLDPFTVTAAELSRLLESRHDLTPLGMQDATLDDWLDLAMTHVIEPRLGGGLVFVRDFPASKAALARIRPGNPALASRFEVYLNGVELANGFHELADTREQRRRFAEDCARREQLRLPAVPVDQRLLDGLAAGLPDCAGVALGLDRLLMIASGAGSLAEVLAFPFELA